MIDDLSFAIVIGTISLISILISYNVVMYYGEKRRDMFSILVSGTSISVILLGSSTISVDVFAISSHEHDSLNIELVSLIYKVVIGIMVFISLVVLPYSYFYVRVRDNRLDLLPGRRTRQRTKYSVECVTTAYMFGFLLTVALLMFIGMLILTGSTHDIIARSSEEWIKELLKDDNRPTWTSVFRFSFGCIASVGMCGWIMYTSFGLVLVPVELCISPGSSSLSLKSQLEREPLLNTSINSSSSSSSSNGGSGKVPPQIHRIESELQIIRKERNSILSRRQITGRQMQRRDRERLSALEERFKTLSNRKQRMKTLHRKHQVRFCEKICSKIARRCELLRVLVGVALLVLSVAIVFALTSTCSDKIENSRFQDGYELSKSMSFWNPLDELFVVMARYFPLDYLGLSVLVLFLFYATIRGIMALGVRCLCFRIYTLKRRRSSPQTLLVVSLLLIFISVAAVVSLQWIIPQYVTFGDQKRNGTLCTPQDSVNLSSSESGCNMSQVSEFLKSLNTAMPIFGATFLVGNFIFLVAWCVTFITAIFGGNPTACLGQETSLGDDSNTNDDDDDEDENYAFVDRKPDDDVLEMSERKT